MSSIDDAISATRAQLKKYRSRGAEINEQNTKASLIDPILAALGWDLLNIDEVDREYKRKSQDNPVDYALLLLRTPRLFIEAKSLGANLQDRKWVSQILGYATVVGVEWCVLTNGDEYRLYNAHAAVDVEEKLFRAVRISEDDEHDVTRATLMLLSKANLGENLLSVLWKAYFIDRQVDAAVRGMWQEPDPGLVRLVQKRVPSLKPSDVRDSLRRADIRVAFPSAAALDAPPRRAARPAKVAAPARSVAPSVTPAAPAPVSPPMHAADEPTTRSAPRRSDVTLADLIAAGHIRPPLRLEKDYKKTLFTASVLADGRVAFGDAVYDSPSSAAGHARMTIVGRDEKWGVPPTNGWAFWRCQDPTTGQMVELDTLRQRLLEERAQAGRGGSR
ncbi:MAG: type I restriction enzyme HsdR N-terminal domain-containing protein [Anaerolineae bacterium]